MTDFLSHLSRTSRRLKEAKQKVGGPRNAGSQLQPGKLSAAALERLFAFLDATKLFDTEYYSKTYPDILNSDLAPIEHFFFHGYLEGRRPNPVFDPSWYLLTNADVSEAGAQPLLQYVVSGESEGRRPGPYFDPVWYRKTYRIKEGVSALAHYLAYRTGPYSPIPEFDSKYYLETYKDVALAAVDPFEHYVFSGYREGRNPSASFDSRFYIRRYLKGQFDQNPLLHYLANRNDPNIVPMPPEDDATIPSQVKKFTKPGPYFEDFRPISSGRRPLAKILAYYLPQFHAVPENDKWWGKGFTEWNNLARGIPRFKDHYQPRIPRDLGFYSLENIETIRTQANLARSAGVSGFIFYYYWFNQKRLLEGPVEQFLKTQDIDMPFCLMWANENWTRRWDGMESEVLISQDYRAQDEEKLLGDFARHFADPRYIRIQNRPLLMIYRVGLIPDAINRIARWREIFEQRFNERPILVMSQSFNDEDPAQFGVDGAIEFPPHKVTRNIPEATTDLLYLDDSFNGKIYSYDDVARWSLDEAQPTFPLIKTLVPSWDNDARRQGSGLIIHGSTPTKYEAWLSALVKRAQDNKFFGEPIVCVNAWNEWCEAAYLEPDLHFGSAYLNATARAVTGQGHNSLRQRLLLVGHDAFPSGAQHLLLNIGKTLRSEFGVDIEFLLLDGGQLEAEYASVATVTVMRDKNALTKKIQAYRESGVVAAIINTSVCGETVPLLRKAGFYTVMLVHELPRLLKEKMVLAAAATGLASADKVLFASAFGRDKICAELKISRPDHFIVRPQGSYKNVLPVAKKTASLRKQLGIELEAPVVLGVGYADVRKGFDLFLQICRMNVGSGIRFCWVGAVSPELDQMLAHEIKELTALKALYLVGYRDDVDAFYGMANAFLLTSREDPLPTVALEALSAGVPVFAFEGSGGIPELLLENSVGFVAPFCDVLTMNADLRSALAKRSDTKMSSRAQKLIEEKFSFDSYANDLFHIALPNLPSVSVAVPNYNYGHCLKERLCTIFDQTLPVEEVFVLDDASSDNSIAVIEETAEEQGRNLNLVINDKNSGSVFAQWKKATEYAGGDFIWIAEADDLSEPEFLSRLVAAMNSDPDIKIGFSDSRSIDAEGALVYPSYKPYFATVRPGALTKDEIFDGREFASQFLSIKNTILNVSSVLWRRADLQDAISRCQADLHRFKMAGDWRLYVELLLTSRAKIAYVAEPLNVHRRHSQSVTHSLNAERHVDEISRMHKLLKDRLRLPRKVASLQLAYLAEVRSQMGL